MTKEQLVEDILAMLPPRQSELGMARANLQEMPEAELQRLHDDLTEVAERFTPSPDTPEQAALRSAAQAQLEEGLRLLGTAKRAERAYKARHMAT